MNKTMSKAADCVLVLFAALFLVIAAIGLFNSSLDARVQMLIALGASGLVLAAVASRHLFPPRCSAFRPEAGGSRSSTSPGRRGGCR